MGGISSKSDDVKRLDISESDAKRLDEFRRDHLYYINQLLGDQTLRNIIQEEFPHKSEWNLETEKADERFDNSFHHYVDMKNDGRWCSVDQNIQDLNEHPEDTLCQTYSMMKFMGWLHNDKKLTKELQIRMIKMWRFILQNEAVTEQIIHSVLLNKKSKIPTTKAIKSGRVKYLMENILDSDRKDGKVIDGIKYVLNDWENDGWKLFLLRTKLP